MLTELLTPYQRTRRPAIEEPVSSRAEHPHQREGCEHVVVVRGEVHVVGEVDPGAVLVLVLALLPHARSR